ncbi:MAG: FecR domain-containing protein [Pseudomonadota bacterium]
MSGNEPSHDDYLWDRSDPPDPEIRRLECLLGGYAWNPDSARSARAHRAVDAHAAPRAGAWRRARWRRAALAAVAAFALCAIGAQVWYSQRLRWENDRPWRVAMQQGDVRIDGQAVAADAVLPKGRELRTGPDASVRLDVARVGQMVLGENSVIRIVETRSGRHRVQLQEGRLWARVWAPPGQFAIGLPHADLHDLGCEFVVESDAAGNARLTVRSGWVLVDDGRADVLVPEGTTVRVHDDRRAGLPHDLGARPEFVAALDAIDAAHGAVDPRGEEIRSLIAAARTQDAISLLSLLKRYPQLAEQPLLASTARTLPGVRALSPAEVRARGDAAFDDWWRALPYPRIKRWWLKWPDALPASGDPAELLDPSRSGRD